MRRIDIENKTIKIRMGDFAYDASLVRALKAIPFAVFRSVPEKAWFLPLDEAPMAASLGNLFGFEVADPVQHLADLALQEKRKESEQNASALAALGDLSAPLPNGRILFEHQRAGAQKLIESGRHILADEMGLGKTLTSLITALGYQRAFGWQIVVLTTVSVRPGWYQEAEGINAPIEAHSWAKVPDPPERDFILIADEAHYAQSLTSQRTQRFLELARRARRVFALTGTPMKNGQPVNLFPLLLACRHRLARDKKYFEERYCSAQLVKRQVKKNGKKKEVTTRDVRGASNLKELHNLTRDIILIRKKAQCLDLPPKTRQLRQVEASLDAARHYNEVIAAKRDELQLLVARGKFPEESQALVMLGAIRQAASAVKIVTALEIAEQAVEEGGQIVLFTEFLATAHAIFEAAKSAKLRPEILTGATKADDRKPIVDRFQNGDSKVFIGTIKAGGVGITLTKASTIVLVDRAWTPGDNFQAEDRCHRISQHWPVTAIWLQYGGLDHRIDSLILKKQERIDLVLEGKRKTMRGVQQSITSSAGELLREITREQ
jgi:SNF2 family DNA or RNA helicase